MRFAIGEVADGANRYQLGRRREQLDADHCAKPEQDERCGREDDQRAPLAPLFLGESNRAFS